MAEAHNVADNIVYTPYPAARRGELGQCPGPAPSDAGIGTDDQPVQCARLLHQEGAPLLTLLRLCVIFGVVTVIVQARRVKGSAHRRPRDLPLVATNVGSGAISVMTISWR